MLFSDIVKVDDRSKNRITNVGTSMKHAYLHQQRGSPLRKYLILVCVGRGLDLDLRVCPAAPAVSGNLGFGPPLGLRSKTHGFQTAWMIKDHFFREDISNRVFSY